MTASPAELRALLALVGGSLGAVVVAVALLVRSGRVVRYPDVAAPGSTVRTRGGDHVSIV